MLFDLRAPGRKRLIQAVYLTLAVVLVGGLVLFGVGSGLPGLLDGNSSGGGGDLAKEQQERVERAEKAVLARPRDGKALAELASARFDVAAGHVDQETGALTDEGKRRFAEVADTWRRYLETDPKPVDASLAKKMVQVFQPGVLNKPAEWADAQGVVTQDAVDRAEKAGVRPPAASYLQLMQAELAAGRKRQAKIHGAAAIAAASPQQRAEVKAQVEALEKGGQQAAASGGAATSTTPTTITLPDE